ncbi:MAG: HEAT repeat domain-containing protein [Promethearchaeota archaeon]
MPEFNPRSRGRIPSDITSKADPENIECSQERQKIIASLSSENQEDRRSAIRLLGQQGPEASEALPELREALKDPNHIIRLEAAIAIGFIGTQEEVPRLIPLLNDHVSAVRFQTISSLAFLRDSQVTSILIDRFEGETPENRDQILRAIGQLGGPRVFDTLKRGLTDRDPMVRLGAAVGFGFLLDPRAKPLLQHVVEHDEDELVSHEARISLRLLMHNTNGTENNCDS